MRIGKFLGAELELSLDSYIDASETQIAGDSLKLSVLGPEGYVNHVSLPIPQLRPLLDSFGVESVEELGGHSVYALYENMKLKGVFKR